MAHNGEATGSGGIAWARAGEERLSRPHDHAVQFYDQDSFLIETIAGFVADGLAQGEAAIVVSTENHRRLIDRGLEERGVDLIQARSSGLYRPLDAAVTLDLFMVDDWPDAARFAEAIGGHVERAEERAPRVRAFGEMVALLWDEGKREAAIRLEELWCELVSARGISLLCAYPLGGFGRASDQGAFRRVCGRHDRVLPTEDYSALGDDASRLREVSELQQRARALESEVQQRGVTERALEERNQMLHALVDASPLPIAVINLDETVRLWNRSAERLFGWSEDEVLGRPLPVLPTEKPEDFAWIREAVSQGRTTQRMEVRRRRRDGKPIDLLVSIAPLGDPARGVHGIVLLYEDVTERNRLEAGRQKSLRELTILYHVGQVLAAELDLERLLQAITDAARQLTGASYGAFLYKSNDRGGNLVQYTVSGAASGDFETVMTPRTTELFAAAFPGSGAVRIDDVRTDPGFSRSSRVPGLLPDQTTVSYLAVPVLTRTGRTFGGFFLGHPEPGMFNEESARVIGALAAQAATAIDNARLYDAERRARGEAEAASRAKDQFLAMLGHELRNPLSTVRSAIATARLDGSQRDRALEVARRGADQLGRLVDDLLDVARITQGRISLENDRLSVKSMVERAIETAQVLIEERGHEIVVSFESDDAFVDGDATRLEQVVVNLLTNAAKYTDPGGRIDVVVEPDGAQVVLRVRDNGIGISAEMLPRVFELFAQADRALDRSLGGLGIGLTIVKQLVELHGGRVEARSGGLGMGSEFVVRLPGKNPPETKEKSAQKDASRGYARILIVEDNADAAEGLMMLLEVLGHRVSVVGDGPSALEAARAEVPDVMLIDIGLPGMDGYEVAQRIREEPELGSVVLVALTGYGAEEDRQRALGAGFDYHLVKPVDVDKLTGLVSALPNGAAASESKTVH